MLVFLLLFFLHFILRRISNVGTLQLRDAHCSKVISAVCQAPGNQLAALLRDNISSKRMTVKIGPDFAPLLPAFYNLQNNFYKGTLLTPETDSGSTGELADVKTGKQLPSDLAAHKIEHKAV